MKYQNGIKDFLIPFCCYAIIENVRTYVFDQNDKIKKIRGTIMKKRETTRTIQVGNVAIGGKQNVVIQSMTNTKTKDIVATVNQILQLEQVRM